jgi:uncharacterized membrane protein YfcA
LAVVFTTANVMTLGAFVVSGDLTIRLTSWSLAMLPVLIVGVAIGSRWRRRVTEISARRLVLGLLGIAGISALASSLIG